MNPGDKEVAWTDLKRSERTMIVARAIGAPWAFFQVFTYSERPYPEGVQQLAYLLVALLVVGNIAVYVASKRVRTFEGSQRLAGASLSLDILVIGGIVWLFGFDPVTAMWAVLFILPLEGAIRFQLTGALAAWAGATLLYTGRELYVSERYGFVLEWNSITFRMGIALIIAVVAGLMARDLMKQREQLATALEEVRAVDRLRAALVNTLAHDVRNPLTAIQGSIKTLVNRKELVGTESAIGLLESAGRQADRLTRMANDLLELARLEEGRLELKLEPVPLKHSVETSLSFLESAYRIENRIPAELIVQADPERLQQVVVNLASNALRYGEPPFIAEAQRSNGSVELVFEDHGPGVDAAKRSSLFEPFGSSEGAGSVGFGLAIVKALVEAQGGRVTYEPIEPRGARFKVSLPAAEPATT